VEGLKKKKKKKKKRGSRVKFNQKQLEFCVDVCEKVIVY
jgi:hypothetical protein